MAEIAAPAKETKAQRIERLKREKNPWEAFDEVRAFAREGRSSVAPEWASAYFKWWGVYTQGDGVGAIGGKNGEGNATEYFMMRIGIPNGILTAEQVRAIGVITRKYARNIADITVRQNIQLHWITIESLPEVVDILHTVGLSPKGSSGDVTRNVTGCPLAGIEHDEILDASPLSIAVAHMLTANPDFYNLPRKFKITITGCPVWCSHPEINDIGMTAIKRGDEIGYSVRVGGGLSAEPHLAVRLDAFVRQDQALDVVRTIAEIFRDQVGLRESRDRARFKHLFLKEGWTGDRVLSELNHRLGYQLDPAVPEIPPNDILRDHVGIHRQKQAGLSFVGASILRGRITGEQLEAAADLAIRYGSGGLRATVMQNLLFIDVPNEKVVSLAQELNKIDLHVDGSSFWRGAISCTGTEFCKLAVTETKTFTRWLVEEMELRIPEFDQQLKLHVTGCSNSCGQHWIADIGIEGKKVKHDGKLVDAFYFCIGGAVGQYARTARPLGYRCIASEVPDAIERLLRSYLTNRISGENLREWFSRHDDASLRTQLAGETFDPVARDLPAGPPPRGVAD
jgi:sulfite reductase (ferredoxin)